jgi:hypothetical protein
MNKELAIVSAILALLIIVTPAIALAQTNGYNLTVNITAYQFGNPTVTVEAKTANGNYYLFFW